MWVKTDEQKPIDGAVVKTKIDDGKGERNRQSLEYRDGVWWTGGTKVKYTPTHWEL